MDRSNVHSFALLLGLLRPLPRPLKPSNRFVGLVRPLVCTNRFFYEPSNDLRHALLQQPRPALVPFSSLWDQLVPSLCICSIYVYKKKNVLSHHNNHDYHHHHRRRRPPSFTRPSRHRSSPVLPLGSIRFELVRQSVGNRHEGCSTGHFMRPQQWQ